MDLSVVILPKLLKNILLCEGREYVSEAMKTYGGYGGEAGI
jgi:hypothetical protein